MAKKLRKLERVVVDRVDLVDRGDNPDALITLVKRADTKQVPSTNVKKLNFKESKETEKVIDKFKQVCNSTNKGKNEPAKDLTGGNKMPKTEEGQTTELDTLKEQLETVNSELEKVKKDLETRDSELAAANEQVEKLTKKEPEAETEEDIWKGLPENVRKQFEDMKAKADEAENIAKAEREKRETAEITKQVNEDFKALSGEVADKVEIVREVRKALSDEQFEKFTNILKAASTAISESKALTETGTEGAEDEGTDAYSKMEKLAKQISKDEGVTKEKGFMLAVDRNPELYAEYVKEQRTR